MEMIHDQIQSRLQDWFMRTTANNGTRRVGDLQIALTSDIGLVREENQDRIAVLRVQSRIRSFLVAALSDGMGGMVDGAVCASMALSSFLSACIRLREQPVEQRLAAAAFAANETVFDAFQGKGGATLSAIMVDTSGGIAGVNVGDSRIYGTMNGLLEQLTQDDTIAGQFDKNYGDQNNHHGRNDLLQFIGVGPDIEPHSINFFPFSPKSKLFLTTDGIHFLNHEVMESVILNAEDSATAIRRLSELSKWCGGKDNASAIVLSSVQTLLNESNVHTPNVIEVWDAFNDLQIVFFDHDQPSHPSRLPFQQVKSVPEGQLEKETPKETRNKTNKTKKTKKQRKFDNKKKKKTTKKSGKKDKIRKKEENAKPQLKIDFDQGGESSNA